MSNHIDVLSYNEPFVDMSRATLELLSREMGELDFASRRTLLTKGEAGDTVYVTNESRRRLESEGMHLVTRGSGECVSEFSLVTYTDGVTEERNADGRMFGEQRLESLTSENAHLDAAQKKRRYSSRCPCQLDPAK